MHIQFYSSNFLRMFSYFPIVKMAAKYSKIDTVGSSDASSQQVPPVQSF